MSRLLLVVSFVCFGCVHALAQKPAVPLDFSVERGSRFRQILKHDNGVAVIYGRSDWFFYTSRLTLNIHDTAGGLLRQRKLNLLANGQPAYLVHAFSAPDALLFLCAVPFKDRSDNGLCVLRYEPTTEKLAVSIGVKEHDALPDGWLLNGETQVVFSADSSQAVVCIFSPALPGRQPQVTALSFDVRAPNRHRLITAPLPNHGSRYEIKQTLVDNDGSVYLLGKRYVNGAAEIKDNAANYHYTLHRLENTEAKFLCTFPADGHIPRSFAGAIRENMFTGHGLLTDTALADHDSLYTVMARLEDCMSTVVRITPLNGGGAADTSFANNTFVSHSFQTSDGLVTAFERQRVSYAESARAGGGFAFERGNALVVLSGSGTEEMRMFTHVKYQRFNELPASSLSVFNHNGFLYAAYAEYSEAYNRFSKLHVVNLMSSLETTVNLHHVDWQKEDPYYLLKVGNTLVLMQPHMRNYSLFRILLP